MGQKVNPISFRICNGNSRTWFSNWFAKNKKDYVENVISDLKVQDFFHENASKYSVGVVNIERRQNKKMKICLQSGKISLVIGKKGENIENIEKQLKSKLNNQDISFDVKELKHPSLNANIIARTVADKIENRQSFKRAAKSAIEQAMKSNAVGIKISCSGRLNGAEIARSEKFRQGVIPLHTLSANIDYAYQEAFTTYGTIGIKVWICTKR
jgi:small subunit ribosomal protein S3